MLRLYQVLGDEQSLTGWEINEPIRIIVVRSAYFHCPYKLFWYSEVPGGSDNDPRPFHSSDDAGGLTSGQLRASSHLTHVRSGLGRNRGIVIPGIATSSLTAVR